MLKWYGSSTLLWGYSFDRICKQFAAAGFEGVEVWAEQFWHEQMLPEDLLGSTRSNHLDISVHAAIKDVNLFSLNEWARQYSLSEVERSMELASTLQATSITIHPGLLMPYEQWQRSHTEQLYHSLNKLEVLAERLGITLSIKLLEFMHNKNEISPRLANELIDHRSQYVTTAFDVAYVPASQSAKELLKKLHRVDKIHLSDATAHALHMPLGEGELDILTAMDTIKGMDKPIIIEGFDYLGKNNALEKNVQYLLDTGLLREKWVRV